MNLFVLLLAGCISGDSPQNEPVKTQKAKAPAQKAPAAKKSKKKSGGDHLPPTARSTKMKPLGVSGDVQGQLKLDVTEVEGVVKTDAAIAFTWDGGNETVSLGTAPGTCTEMSPKPMEDGVIPLWSAECLFNDVTSLVAMAQGGTTLFVRRTVVDKEGNQGIAKMLKKIPLTEGVRVVRSDGTAPEPLQLPNKEDGANAESSEEE